MEYRQVGVLAGKGSEPHQFAEALRGLAVDQTDLIFAAGDSAVKAFDAGGALRRSWTTSRPGFCAAVAEDGTLWVGQEEQVEIFTPEGALADTWRDPKRLGLVTALALTGENILIADARQRCIRRFDRQRTFVNDIGRDNRRGGFTIPNGVLDFAVDQRGVIHAANPGMHRVQRYGLDGTLLGHFGRFGGGGDPAGFQGCCNPTNVALDAQGRVIVTEKAGPRAKVYDQEGRLLSVVGADAFDPGCKNMDLAVDSRGRIYVIDTVRLSICVFAPAAGAANDQEGEAAKVPGR